MNVPVAWYLARSSGIVASVLVTLSVVWGLLLSTRLLRQPRPAWWLDLHRFLGAASIAFVALHIGALVADNTIDFGPKEVLVPFASGWRPAAVAWGVIGFWLLVIIESTSLFMRRIPRKVWHGVHLTSYLLFWLVAIHGTTAGSDARNPVYAWASITAIVVVLFLTVYRATAGRRPPRVRTRPAGSHPPPQPAPSP